MYVTSHCKIAIAIVCVFVASCFYIIKTCY